MNTTDDITDVDLTTSEYLDVLFAARSLARRCRPGETPVWEFEDDEVTAVDLVTQGPSAALVREGR
jgi:hypothetical protein